MRKVMGVLAAVLGVCFASATPAAGFAIENPRWQVDAETQYSYLNPPCGEPNYGGYPATTCYISFKYSGDITGRGWDAAIRGGAYNWCNKPDAHTTPPLAKDFCYEDYTFDASCVVNCNQVSVGVQDLGGPNPNGTQTVGVTEISSTDAATYAFTHVDIYMSTNAHINWYIPNGQPIGATQTDLTSFTMHEFGHALGLAHPGQGPEAVGPVMNCILELGTQYSGVDDDFNGLRWIYGGNNPAYGTPVTSPC